MERRVTKVLVALAAVFHRPISVPDSNADDGQQSFCKQPPMCCPYRRFRGAPEAPFGVQPHLVPMRRCAPRSCAADERSLGQDEEVEKRVKPLADTLLRGPSWI